MHLLIEYFFQWWLPIVLIVLAALVLHKALFFSVSRFSKNRSSARVIAKKVEFPTLLLFLFLGIFALIDFSALPEPYCDGAFFSTEFFLLLTVAWWVLRFFSGLLEYQIHQLHEKNDRVRRAHVTQLSFAYKIVSLLVIFFIVGAIFLISPGLKTLGLGLLGSAGIAGIAIGVAAQPLLLNFMAGFQLVMNKTLNIGDSVFIAGDHCTVEEIKTTQVILRTWDGRRHIYPVSTFIQEPYQNWDLKDASKLARVSIFCDYSVPVAALRKRYEEYIATEPLFNGRVSALFIMDFSHDAVEIVCQCSANSPAELFQLKYKVREEMLCFIQEKYPSAMPHIRYKKEIPYA
jgi:small-conductance mechanosensitive channel